MGSGNRRRLNRRKNFRNLIYILNKRNCIFAEHLKGVQIFVKSEGVATSFNASKANVKL